MRARDLVKILGRDDPGFGFAFYRQGKGSHEEWSNGEHTVTIVMGHSGDMAPGTVRQIFEDAGLKFLGGVKSVAEADIRIRDHFEQAARAEQEAAQNATMSLADMGMAPDQVALFEKLPSSMDHIHVGNHGISEALEELVLTKEIFEEAENDEDRQFAAAEFITAFYTMDKAALVSVTRAVDNIDQFVSHAPPDSGTIAAEFVEASEPTSGHITVDKAALEDDAAPMLTEDVDIAASVTKRNP